MLTRFTDQLAPLVSLPSGATVAYIQQCSPSRPFAPPLSFPPAYVSVCQVDPSLRDD